MSLNDIMFLVKDMEKVIVGVDIGGTSIKMGLFSMEGTLLEKWNIPTNTEEQGKWILKEIYESIKEHTAGYKLHGIGFGVPAPVKDNVVLNGVNLGWINKNVKEEFLALLKDDSVFIRVSNDANVATAGEFYAGVAKGYQNVIMITLGTGIGGGVMINSHIFDGMNGVAGEIGHIVVDFEHQFQCNCGKKGCLETVASATGIVRLAKYHLEHSKEPSVLRDMHYMSAKKVIDAAKENDFIAVEVMKEVANYLAYLMGVMTNTLNPDIFVIGGGVSNAGDYLIDLIKVSYYDYVRPFIKETNFAIASLGNDAGIYGAFYMVAPR